MSRVDKFTQFRFFLFISTAHRRVIRRILDDFLSLYPRWQLIKISGQVLRGETREKRMCASIRVRAAATVDVRRAVDGESARLPRPSTARARIRQRRL